MLLISNAHVLTLLCALALVMSGIVELSATIVYIHNVQLYLNNNQFQRN